MKKLINGNRWTELRHYWLEDVIAAFQVSLIAIAFGLGISVASGAPPISGLISAIVAGPILWYFRGSWVTISGPAAGLAPIILVSIISLGGGDIGYQRVLAAIMIAGAIQVVMAYMKLAKVASIFPSSVVEGMLGAIGLMIIVKQIPLILGVRFDGHEFWEMVAEIPEHIQQTNGNVFMVGAVTLMTIIFLSYLKGWLMKRLEKKGMAESPQAQRVNLIQPQVLGLFVGIGLGSYLGLGKEFLIGIPDRGIQEWVTFPKFSDFWQDLSLIIPLAIAATKLLFIDGVESLATIKAVDKKDFYHRKSDPNQTLKAMGWSNMISALLGGLTIIPGGIKSSANIFAGGKTPWANLFVSGFVFLYVVIGRDLINQIPLAALAALVVSIGWKLCKPAVWKHIAHIGLQQLLVFSVTVLVTVSSDLLIGIGAGLAVKLFVIAWKGDIFQAQTGTTLWSRTKDLFRNPVTIESEGDGKYVLRFDRSVTCANLLHTERALEEIPADATHVRYAFSLSVHIIDHTSASALKDFAKKFAADERGTVDVDGLDSMEMVRLGNHPDAFRVRAKKVLVTAGTNGNGNGSPSID